MLWLVHLKMTRKSHNCILAIVVTLMKVVIKVMQITPKCVFWATICNRLDNILPKDINQLIVVKSFTCNFSLKIHKVTFRIWPKFGIFQFYQMVKFSLSFREHVILVSRCFVKWPKSPKIRRNIPYPFTCEHKHVKDWDNTTILNPHTIWRSIFVEWCHNMYGVNPRTMNWWCLIHGLPTLRHVGCTTSPMSSNENPLTNHRSAYMHYTSLPLAIKIGSWHTFLQVDICHRYRKPTTLCTWTWQPSTRSNISKTLNIF